jgi:putative endonuclease
LFWRRARALPARLAKAIAERAGRQGFPPKANPPGAGNGPHSAPKAHPPGAGKCSIILTMYYTYILYSKKLKKFYIGSTSDIKKRIKQHNNGIVPFTSRGVPWTCPYCEIFLIKEDAIREEKFLKSGKGRERRNYLLKSFIENDK